MSDKSKSNSQSGDPEKGEIQRRLTALENSVSDLEKHAFERHARTITWIFTAVSLVVGLSSLSVAIMSSSSRADSREATIEMKQDAENKWADLEKRFQALAGESLKKPFLTIANRSGLLEGQTITNQNNQIQIFPLFIKNDGDKKSGAISVRLYSSVDLGYNFGSDLQPVEGNNKEYPFSYYLPILGRTIDIAPQETETLDVGASQLNSLPSTNMASCKLQIFYESEKPAEAQFQIKLR